MLLSLLLATRPSLVFGQMQPPVDYLHISGADARTWTQGTTQIVLVHGPVNIDLESVHASATSAIIWLTPTSDGVVQQQEAQVALIGSAVVTQDNMQRSGPSLFLDAIVRGDIRLAAPPDKRLDLDLSSSPLYQQAAQMKAAAAGPPIYPATPLKPLPYETLDILKPAAFEFKHIQTVQTPEDKVAAVLSGGVTIVYRSPKNESLEFQAERAVVFTKLHSLGQIGQGQKVRSIQDNVESIYLEGDARITYSPVTGKGAEQRLLANRAYYELSTDRAILTDVVLHTSDPKSAIPITVRAQTVRQLSHNEFQTDHVLLSSSSFATPSFSVAATRAYIEQLPTDEETNETQTYYIAKNAKVDMFGFPLFYFPYTSGTVNNRGIALRQIQIGKSDYFGFHMKTTWGFFESIGEPAPPNLDISYHVDYYDTRGPASGVDAEYYGGYINNGTKEAWDYAGAFKSYIIDDTGNDQFGGDRREVDPAEDFDKRFARSFPMDAPILHAGRLAGAASRGLCIGSEFFGRVGSG